jgi:hypothetical protein
MNRLDYASAAAALTAIHAMFDGGSAHTVGKLEIRSGTKPSDPSVAPTDGVILATFDFPASPVFNAPTQITNAAQATAKAIADVLAGNDGTATWWRAYDKDYVARQDGDASDTNGTGSLKLANTAIVNGVSVKIVSWTGTMPQ